MNHLRLPGLLVTAIAAIVPSDVRADDEPAPAGGFRAAPTPTLIIVNALVWTGVEGEPDAEALAITGSQITAVGQSEGIRALAGPQTTVIDGGGRRVIPGITDSHTHVVASGLQLTRLDLRNATDRAEFVDLVAAAAARLSPGQWLLGGRYSVESWETPEAPMRAWIDPVTPGTPVFLTRMDGHQALANSVALKYARIDRDGPEDPPGGEIERDPRTGEPTGILKDDAMALVGRHIPPEDRRAKYDALQLAMQVLNAWGITSIHDMSDVDDLPLFMLARRRHVLTVRVRSYVQSEDFEATWPAIQAVATEQDDMFRVAGFKAFMDGSLGSRTAYMRDPYADATETTKYPRGFRAGQAADLATFQKQIAWAHERGLQMAVHAIGDQANHELLDIYATLPNGKARRHRIEHAQHLLPEDIPRFAPLGVMASLQPFHKADDGRYAERALGPRRAQTSYAFNSLLATGATVCFGSDTPVVSANPFSGITAAVSGRTMAGEVWVPEQSIARREALKCYTVTPPYAAFAEDRLGTLEAGKLADVVILDKDVLRAPLEHLHETEAYMTIVDGRVVWRSAAAGTGTRNDE